MNNTEKKIREILSHVDHTQLRPTATWEEIRETCEEGIRYGTATVCLPPAFVREAVDYVAGRIPVCTVIGFPNGYNTTAVKCFEAEEAVRNGASEIDMVIRLGWVKEQRYDDVTKEIRAVREACDGKLLKVIVETCLMNREEKLRLCDAVAESGADYIKTSTGFSAGGATEEDLRLMASRVPAHLKIKAAGGIRSLEDAETFLSLGASRLGTSSIVRLVREQNLLGGEEKQ